MLNAFLRSRRAVSTGPLPEALGKLPLLDGLCNVPTPATSPSRIQEARMIGQWQKA
jgi:hypothetical protein